MDGIADGRGQAGRPDAVQAFKQPTDVVGGRRGSHVVEPGQWRQTGLWIDDQDCVQPGDAVGRHAGQHGIIGTLPGTGSSGESGALDHRRRR